MSDVTRKIQVVKFGNQRSEITVTGKDGNEPTWGDAYNQIEGADGKHVCVYGEEIQEHMDEAVREDVTIFVAPKKIAQGGFLQDKWLQVRAWLQSYTARKS